MKKSIPLLAAVATGFLALTTLAHDAWVDPLGGPVYKVLYGHKVPEKYPVVKVTSLKVLDARQQPLKFARTPLKDGVSITPLGQRIEFVPVGLTGLPKAGSQLKLHLLLDGQPLAGQMVENNSNETGPKTDTNGDVTVTVLKGINRFATDHDIMQANMPDAQRLSLTAALVFVAK